MQVSKICADTNSFSGKFTEFEIDELEAPRDRIKILTHRVVYNPFKGETKREIDAAIDKYVKENQKTTIEIKRDKKWKILDRIKCYVGIVVDKDVEKENA